jgi:hypothetical protein
MKTRPRSITIIAWVFIAVGAIALVGSLVTASQRVAELEPVELALASIVRLVAILGGAFMLYGRNWARWLLAAWLVYHIVLSAFHSPLQLVVHGLLFGLILYFLFRPAASNYFRNTQTPEKNG